MDDGRWTVNGQESKLAMDGRCLQYGYWSRPSPSMYRAGDAQQSHDTDRQALIWIDSESRFDLHLFSYSFMN